MLLSSQYLPRHSKTGAVPDYKWCCQSKLAEQHWWAGAPRHLAQGSLLATCSIPGGRGGVQGAPNAGAAALSVVGGEGAGQQWGQLLGGACPALRLHWWRWWLAAHARGACQACPVAQPEAVPPPWGIRPRPPRGLLSLGIFLAALRRPQSPAEQRGLHDRRRCADPFGWHPVQAA